MTAKNQCFKINQRNEIFDCLFLYSKSLLNSVAQKSIKFFFFMSHSIYRLGIQEGMEWVFLAWGLSYNCSQKLDRSGKDD